MGKLWKQWQSLFFFFGGGLQNHCRWWLQPWNKKCLRFERKAMTNLDSILKSRDVTLPTKVHLVKAMVFPVVMYQCDSCTIKKAEHWRIDASELWCSPHTLATWCEELTLWKRPWCWERLKAGEEGDNRGWDGWMSSPTQWTWIWVNSGSWWWTEMHSWTWLSNWAELNWSWGEGGDIGSTWKCWAGLSWVEGARPRQGKYLCSGWKHWPSTTLNTYGLIYSITQKRQLSLETFATCLNVCSY